MCYSETNRVMVAQYVSNNRHYSVRNVYVPVHDMCAAVVQTR